MMMRLDKNICDENLDAKYHWNETKIRLDANETWSFAMVNLNEGNFLCFITLKCVVAPFFGFEKLLLLHLTHF